MNEDFEPLTPSLWFADCNEDYCKWCYSDGHFVYPSKDTLLDYLAAHMPNPEQLDNETRRVQFDAYLSQLKHWK